MLRLPLEVVAPSPEPGPLRAALLLGLVVVLLGAAWLVPGPLVLRAIASVAIFLGALFALSRRRARSPVAIGWVCVDADGIVRRDDAGARSIATWSEPFGLTVLANEARGRAILAFTTPTQTRYIHVRMAPEAALHAGAGAPGEVIDDGGVLARAVTVADGDLQGDARVALGMNDAGRVVRTVAAKCPGAFDRIYLSDSSGGGVTLDGGVLRVGERSFDLAAPLEWRGFMFHESGASVATIYQGTWVKQAGVEVVLVAPMPAEASPPAAGSAAPPRELRVAVERLFMVPLRRALDRAPRVSRPGITPRDGRPAALP
jgi:hypothetical protein